MLSRSALDLIYRSQWTVWWRCAFISFGWNGGDSPAASQASELWSSSGIGPKRSLLSGVRPRCGQPTTIWPQQSVQVRCHWFGLCSTARPSSLHVCSSPKPRCVTRRTRACLCCCHRYEAGKSFELSGSWEFGQGTMNFQQKYGTSGYFVYLPNNNATLASEIIAGLEMDFIDEQTRVVSVTWILFTPSERIFTVCQAIVEFNPTGHLEVTGRTFSYPFLLVRATICLMPYAPYPIHMPHVPYPIPHMPCSIPHTPYPTLHTPYPIPHPTFFVLLSDACRLPCSLRAWQTSSTMSGPYAVWHT